MSVLVMGYVWNINLRPVEKLVLLAYADHAHHDGTHIFPSRQTIAEKTNLSKRTVQRVTQDLIANGFLVSEGKHEKYQTDLFSIPLPPYLGGDRVSPPIDEGVTERHGGVTASTNGGDRVSPEPSLTTNNKPSIEDIKNAGGLGGYIYSLYDLSAEDIDSGTRKELDRLVMIHDEQKLASVAKDSYDDNPGQTLRKLLGTVSRKAKYL